MKTRRIAAGLVTIACGATLAFAACGDKKGENDSNGTDDNASNNGTNNGTNNGPNNGSNGSNNGSNNGPNNASNNVVDPEPAEFGLDTRPANTTCLAFDRPPSASSVTTERVFENLSFDNPVWMSRSPDATDNRWFVVEQSGVIHAFLDDPQVDDTRSFLDIRQRVQDGGERGLLGMAFHPQWPTTPELFVSYTRDEGQLESVISRFTSSDGGQSIDPDSEEIILTRDQPFGNHNGGQISFGPDGFLYIGFGDGGSGGDPRGHGQNTGTMLGALLRIDVTGGESPYGIPADNPFADGRGGRPEIYAWGLRNPWRFSFDMESGALWLGDVGQGEWEEINLIERGGNYGWNAKEGTHCYDQDPCDDGPWLDPVVEYDHSNNNRSVTGGYVYRSQNIPSLYGIYLFADYQSGRVWGIFEDTQTGEPTMRELVQTGQPISSFGQDRNGDVYVVHYSGTLARIVEDEPGATSSFPTNLSETGCADTTDPKRAAAGMIPYDVNAELWSDGAEKHRWFALPDGATITVEADGDWSFPTGSVLRKDFVLDGTVVETRLFVRHEDGEWAGYSYEWNDGGTDALYVAGGKVKDVGGQQWTYPSSGDCLTCHTTAAGRTLGPENAQLAGDFVYPSTNRIADQIDTLAHIGMFEAAPDRDGIAPLADPSGEGDATAQARAYLHANCANCHRQGADLRVAFDLTAGANPLGDAELCNADPLLGDLGVDGAKRLVPGSPELSLMLLRMQRRDAHSMPPLGTLRVDDAGVELVQQWIAGLGSCE